jgi:hypothetical protein
MMNRFVQPSVRLGWLLLIFGAFFAALLMPAHADSQADANRRVVAFAQLMSSLQEDARPDERVRVLEQAEKLLESIPADLAETNIAVDVVSNRPVAGYTLGDIRQKLALAREIAAQTACKIDPSEACIRTILEAALPGVDDRDRVTALGAWARYLLGHGKREEAEAVTKDFEPIDRLDYLPELDGRPALAVARDLAKTPGFNTMLEVASRRHDVESLTTLLSDPVVAASVPIWQLGDLNLSGVTLPPEAKDFLLTKVHDEFFVPEANTRREFNYYSAVRVGNSISKLGARQQMLPHLYRGETLWRERMAKLDLLNFELDYVLDDGLALATLYHVVGATDRRNAIAIKVFDTIRHKPKVLGTYSIVYYCEYVCQAFNDEQIGKLVDVVSSRTDAKDHLALLGISLMHAGHTAIGAQLYRENLTGLKYRERLYLALNRPEELELLAQATEHDKPEVRAMTEVMRILHGDAGQRKQALGNLLTMLPKIEDASQRLSILSEGLSALEEYNP